MEYGEGSQHLAPAWYPLRGCRQRIHGPAAGVADASRNDEARDAVIGFDQLGRLLFVVHIEFEGDCIRIISARAAEPHEEAFYAQ